MSRKERRREKKIGGGAAPASADSREALAQAMQLHQAGRLQEAQGIYLRVLKRELDRLGVFRKFDYRFLDLFNKGD